MMERQGGPVEVRPNPVQGQSMPNTFRSQTGSGTAARQYLNSGGGNTAPPKRLGLPQVPIGVLVLLAVVLVVVALYVLSPTP